MTTTTADPIYGKLLASALPKVIHSERENDRYLKTLLALKQKANRTPQEKDLADLLTLLIEDFEAKHYRLPKASPIEAIIFFMDQHGLKQKDLVDVFGTPSIVSEVLSGKRDLNKEHISRLSKRFRVSPELFF
ncbi:MAG: helix-turn-helix domain-containing protein [Acidobacteriaceae bacterium]